MIRKLWKGEMPFGKCFLATHAFLIAYFAVLTLADYLLAGREVSLFTAYCFTLLSTATLAMAMIISGIALFRSASPVANTMLRYAAKIYSIALTLYAAWSLLWVVRFLLYARR